MSAFYKMTGSGNDFVFVDARHTDAGSLASADRIRAVCARGTGVGADGMVFLEPAPGADVGIRYFNSDGSLATLCGNATLCTIRLAGILGIGNPMELRIATGAGILPARLADGLPEFDLGALDRVTPEVPIDRADGEQRIGYAVAGVPQLVVLVEDVEAVDVPGRGRTLRSHSWTGAAGANVNFVGRVTATEQGAEDRMQTGSASTVSPWTMRTFERGVEGETLACGSGAVVSATMLTMWGLASETPLRLRTRSGAPLLVSVKGEGGGPWRASLRGEGRLVFRGELVDV